MTGRAWISCREICRSPTSLVVDKEPSALMICRGLSFGVVDGECTRKKLTFGAMFRFGLPSAGGGGLLVWELPAPIMLCIRLC